MNPLINDAKADESPPDESMEIAMRKMITGAVGALALAATAIGAAAPAQAQWRGGYRHYGGGYHYGHGGYYGRGGRTGLALGAGALGLALGAAVASNPGRGYYGAPGYYAPPPPPPPAGYYAGGYGYGDPYGYGYCRTDWRWDGYRGRYFPVRYCD